MARTAACLFVLLVSVASGARAAEPSMPAPLERLPAVLTLPQALELYRQHGLDVLIAEAAVMSAEGDVSVAGAVPNPTASLTVGKSVSCSNGHCQGYGAPAFTAGLGDSDALEDFLSGKRGLRLAVARAALRSARQSREDAVRTLSTQVKAQFVQVVLAQETLKLAMDTRAASDQFLALTSNRYKLGAISEADLARVRTATLESHQAVTAAEESLKQARAGLAFLLGVRGRTPEFRAEGAQYAHFTAPPRFVDATPETLLSEARAHRPDLKAIREQVSRAESSVSLARRLVIPDVGLNLGYAVQGLNAFQPGTVTPPTFSLGLAFTLPVFYQQQGEIHKAEADRLTQELQTRKVEAQVASDVETAYAGYTGAAELLRTMESGGLLDSAKRARDLVLFQYQKGAASLLDYLDAQRTYIATAVEYRQDVAGYWSSVFQLEQAVGTPELP